MGFGVSGTSSSLVLIVAASMLVMTVSTVQANPGWWYNGGGGSNDTAAWPWGHRNDSDTLNKSNGPNKIIVGGSTKWTYGFNYSVWAFQNAPFYVNDVLVFKYEPPSQKQPFAHSVYLFPNMWSYLTCDLSRAKLIANTKQGGGKGFEFVLNRWKPYYFACGERNGLHCRDGNMKFFVMPLLRRWHY